MIYLKTASDFEKMRVAGAIVRDTLLLMEEKAKEGVTTAELNKIADAYIRKCGAEPSFLNYNGYPFSICASVNEEVVHGFPSKRALKDGDIVSIDVGAVINGFHGDAARTFLIGNVKEEVRKLVEVTKECFFKGIEAFKDGNRLSDIGIAVQTYAESFGYGVVREMVGHGIGRINFFIMSIFRGRFLLKLWYFRNARRVFCRLSTPSTDFRQDRCPDCRELSSARWQAPYPVQASVPFFP